MRGTGKSGRACRGQVEWIALAAPTSAVVKGGRVISFCYNSRGQRMNLILLVTLATQNDLGYAYYM